METWQTVINTVARMHSARFTSTMWLSANMSIMINAGGGAKSMQKPLSLIKMLSIKCQLLNTVDLFSLEPIPYNSRQNPAKSCVFDQVVGFSCASQKVVPISCNYWKTSCFSKVALNSCKLWISRYIYIYMITTWACPAVKFLIDRRKW